MTWLIWRQHRKQLFWTLAALAALAAVMVPTGLAMRGALDRSGLGSCLAKLGHESLLTGAGGCEGLNQRFQNQYGGLLYVAVLFVLLPVLVGLFFGAPLVAREVENGTHRLVWTQGISRRHWVLAKFGLVGGAAVLLAVAYALGVAWWFGPFAATGQGRLGYLSFDVQGVAPIAYTLFAVALGVYTGTAARKVLPAMGISLAAFAAVRVLVETAVRPYLLPAKTATYAAESGLLPNRYAGDWVFDQVVRNGAGETVLHDGQIGCPPATDPGAADCARNMAEHGFGAGPYTNALEYQPSDRFWTFQGIESGLFLALTALLVFLAVRRIRRIS
ncbi:ABC transporter permease subunit [Kitasatospora sp. NPDC006786]|uniref:ABC transporter permease subunit n=1 Tax=unclassified Kitasatospora TaxID=2633591 RepID=UPI00338B37A7